MRDIGDGVDDDILLFLQLGQLGAVLGDLIGKLLHLGSAAQLSSDFLQGMLGVVVGSGCPHQAVHHRGFHQKGIVRCAL